MGGLKDQVWLKVKELDISRQNAKKRRKDPPYKILSMKSFSML
jgi:hypothetical protein